MAMNATSNTLVNTQDSPTSNALNAAQASPHAPALPSSETRELLVPQNGFHNYHTPAEGHQPPRQPPETPPAAPPPSEVSQEAAAAATGHVHVRVRRLGPAPVGGGGPGAFVREQLFHALFHRAALAYARSVPRTLQRVIEFTLLAQALLSLFVLLFIHVAFVRSPADCLAPVHNLWPRGGGVLRVEVLRDAAPDYGLDESYRREYLHRDRAGFRVEIEKEEAQAKSEVVLESNDTKSGEGDGTWVHGQLERVARRARLVLVDLKRLSALMFYEDLHIFEYSSEFGFLQLSPKTRRRLNISVMHVVLDPASSECMGNGFSRFLLQEFLGYDDVLLSSLQLLSTPGSGYACNIDTGAHYKFVSRPEAETRWTYLFSFLLMILFTLSVSMLLRCSHHQIFSFIVEVLQAFNRLIFLTFPVAQLLIAVSALVGVETLMSRIFTEESTAFFVILTVWLTDQYDAICCHTPISRRYFLRFFFLYHFLFYAYHCRFQGQFSTMAMLTSWLFIQHAMVYFFHHYELPAVLRYAELHRILVHHAALGGAQAARGTSPTPQHQGDIRPSGNPPQALVNTGSDANQNRTPSGTRLASGATGIGRAFAENNRDALIARNRAENSGSSAGNSSLESDRASGTSNGTSETEESSAGNRWRGNSAVERGNVAAEEEAAVRQLLARWLDDPGLEVASYLIVGSNVTLTSDEHTRSQTVDQSNQAEQSDRLVDQSDRFLEQTDLFAAQPDRSAVEADQSVDESETLGESRLTELNCDSVGGSVGAVSQDLGSPSDVTGLNEDCMDEVGDER